MRRIGFLAAVAVLAVLTGGCKTSGDISVDLNVYGIEDPSFASSADTGVEVWEIDHPGIDVIRRDRISDLDFIRLGGMGADHLPDVFITDCKTGRILSDAGLVADLTGIAPDVGTFTYSDGTYAFPVMRESFNLIVYDPLNWTEGSPYGIHSGDPHTVTGCFISSVLSDDEGREWLGHMTASDGQASFTDPLFIDCLDEVRTMIGNCILYGSEEELTEAFVSGELGAAAVSGNDVYKLLDEVRENNPGLYERIEFSPILDNVVPSGFHYGIFVRTGLDDERFELCAGLAQSICTSYVFETDGTLERLFETVDSCRRTGIISDNFIHWFWNYANPECFSILSDGGKTSEEYASILQNYYEIYYTDD